MCYEYDQIQPKQNTIEKIKSVKVICMPEIFNTNIETQFTLWWITVVYFLHKCSNLIGYLSLKQLWTVEDISYTQINQIRFGVAN